MGKVATITFHWATNYGAVLQAYALQKFLIDKDFETEIIDYVPFRVSSIQKLTALKKRDFNFFKKEKQIKEFRKNEMILTAKRFGTNKSLYKCSNKYNAIVCGSDQIWNESFTLFAEGKPTLSYYLNFAGDNTKKIAYAVSFGTPELREQVKKTIKPQIARFNKISVREKSGKDILDNMNISSSVVVDPTLLLSRETYEKLLTKRSISQAPKVFSYIIQNNQINAEKTSRYITNRFEQKDDKNVYGVNCGIYDWLYSIKNSEYVVTNSFHGVVFSIIFNKPFIAIAVENSGMNDRIYTLLSSLGIENRILESYDEDVINNILNNKINWKNVEKNLESLRDWSSKYLMEALRDED